MADNSTAPDPGRSIYGFALFLGCYITLTLYLIWAYIPGEWLKALGITYFPHKSWAIIIPLAVLIFIILFATVLYPLVIYSLTPPLNSITLVKDKYTIGYLPPRNSECIPPISDLNISNVHLDVKTNFEHMISSKFIIPEVCVTVASLQLMAPSVVTQNALRGWHLRCDATYARSI